MCNEKGHGQHFGHGCFPFGGKDMHQMMHLLHIGNCLLSNVNIHYGLQIALH